MSTSVQPARLTSDQVLRIANEDAERMYGDLTDLKVSVRLHSDGWHVEYEPDDPRLQGGGPHYVINPYDGSITSKTYFQ
jgi:hypothetical protein